MLTTPEPYRPSRIMTTGLSPSTASHSRELRLLRGRSKLGSHHIYLLFREGIQFALLGFPSPVLTESLLLSFPAGTKMFQFPAFPLPPEQFGDPWVKGCVRLAKAYRSLPRPSSAIKPNHPPHGLTNTLILANYLCMVSSTLNVIDPSSTILNCELHPQN